MSEVRRPHNLQMQLCAPESVQHELAVGESPGDRPVVCEEKATRSGRLTRRRPAGVWEGRPRGVPGRGSGLMRCRCSDLPPAGGALSAPPHSAVSSLGGSANAGRESASGGRRRGEGIGRGATGPRGRSVYCGHRGLGSGTPAGSSRRGPPAKEDPTRGSDRRGASCPRRPVTGPAAPDESGEMARPLSRLRAGPRRRQTPGVVSSIGSCPLPGPGARPATVPAPAPGNCRASGNRAGAAAPAR